MDVRETYERYMASRTFDSGIVDASGVKLASIGRDHVNFTCPSGNAVAHTGKVGKLQRSN
jgi:hypothetical protein